MDMMEWLTFAIALAKNEFKILAIWLNTENP